MSAIKHYLEKLSEKIGDKGVITKKTICKAENIFKGKHVKRKIKT